MVDCVVAGARPDRTFWKNLLDPSREIFGRSGTRRVCASTVTRARGWTWRPLTASTSRPGAIASSQVCPSLVSIGRLVPSRTSFKNLLDPSREILGRSRTRRVCAFTGTRARGWTRRPSTVSASRPGAIASSQVCALLENSGRIV